MCIRRLTWALVGVGFVLHPLPALSDTTEVAWESAPIAVDWNDDGILDLIVGEDNGYVSLFLGTETGPTVFLPPYLLRAGGKGQPLKVVMESDPTATDWNSDGLLDLLVGDDLGYVNVYLRSDVAGEVLEGGFRARLDSGGFVKVPAEAAPRCIDWNNDGLEDLVVGTMIDDIYVFMNVGTNANRVFSEGEKVKSRSGASYDFPDDCVAPWVGDWNNDGLIDLVVGYCLDIGEETDETAEFHGYRGYIYLYLNIGTSQNPRFETARQMMYSTGQPIDVGASAVPFAYDWSSDGILDLVVGSESGGLFFFRNVGTQVAPRFVLQSRGTIEY